MCIDEWMGADGCMVRWVCIDGWVCMDGPMGVDGWICMDGLMGLYQPSFSANKSKGHWLLV